MTFDEAIALIDYLNKRLRKLNSQWYQWAVPITWEKLRKWEVILKGGKK